MGGVPSPKTSPPHHHLTSHQYLTPPTVCTCAQVMSKAQLPLLTSVIMLGQAFLSAPAGLRAKRSIGDRNQVLLAGLRRHDRRRPDLRLRALRLRCVLAQTFSALRALFQSLTIVGFNCCHRPLNLLASRVMNTMVVVRYYYKLSIQAFTWAGRGCAGMLAGSLFVGVHMALTHGVTLGMVASYIPATQVPGIGRITGTCWSFTDFIFGALCF